MLTLLREVNQTLDFAMTTTREVLDVEDKGFSTVIISEMDDAVHFRINVKTYEDFQHCKELYMKKNNTCFSVKHVYPARERKLFYLITE